MAKRRGIPLYLVGRGELDRADQLRDQVERVIAAGGGSTRYSVAVLTAHREGPWYTDGYAVILNDSLPDLKHLQCARFAIRHSDLGEE